MAIRKTGAASDQVIYDEAEGFARTGSLPPLPPRWAAEDEEALAQENAAADQGDD